MDLVKLDFPSQNIKLRDQDDSVYIFDELRKRWMVCTPEEWVRQNLIMFLISNMNYPKSLIALEKQIKIAGRNLRFDALVYNRNYSPLLIIECKAPQIKITQETFDQILTYNHLINAPYLLVTNGLFHVFCNVRSKSEIKFLEEIPRYEDICSVS